MTTRRAFLLAAIQAAIILLVGCNSSEENSQVSENLMPEDESGNFALDICNASRSRETANIDISVYIDGRIAVKERFRYGDSWWDRWTTASSMGVWKRFRFSLPDGTHTLKVESVAGEAGLEQEFEVEGDCYAHLTYWYRPKWKRSSPPIPRRFTVKFSDEPIGII